MSNPRDVMIAAVVENIGPVVGTPEYLARPGNVERLEARRRNAAASHIDAALSALGEAGYQVVRDEGAHPRAFVEFVLRHTWPERAKAHGYKVVHDIIKHHPFAQMYALSASQEQSDV